MNTYQWLRSIDLEDLPDRSSFGAMWADGVSKKPKIDNPKTKKDYLGFIDLSRKFPYIVNCLFGNMNFTVYLEIGVAYGGGLRLVKKASDQAKVYGIDPLNDPKREKHFISRHGQGRGGYDGSIFVDDQVNFFRTRSDDPNTMSAVKRELAGKIDLLVIDGDHTFEGCYFDLLHYASLVSKLGIVWVDDVGSIEDVSNATDQFLEECKEFVVWDWNGKGKIRSTEGIDGVFLLRKEM